MKTKVKKSLNALELENVVSRKDGYQEIINLIAKVSTELFYTLTNDSDKVLCFPTVHPFILPFVLHLSINWAVPWENVSSGIC